MLKVINMTTPLTVDIILEEYFSSPKASTEYLVKKISGNSELEIANQVKDYIHNSQNRRNIDIVMVCTDEGFHIAGEMDCYYEIDFIKSNTNKEKRVHFANHPSQKKVVYYNTILDRAIHYMQLASDIKSGKIEAKSVKFHCNPFQPEDPENSKEMLDSIAQHIKGGCNKIRLKSVNLPRDKSASQEFVKKFPAHTFHTVNSLCNLDADYIEKNISDLNKSKKSDLDSYSRYKSRFLHAKKNAKKVTESSLKNLIGMDYDVQHKEIKIKQLNDHKTQLQKQHKQEKLKYQETQSEQFDTTPGNAKDLTYKHIGIKFLPFSVTVPILGQDGDRDIIYSVEVYFSIINNIDTQLKATFELKGLDEAFNTSKDKHNKNLLENIKDAIGSFFNERKRFVEEQGNEFQKPIDTEEFFTFFDSFVNFSHARELISRSQELKKNTKETYPKTNALFAKISNALKTLKLDLKGMQSELESVLKKEFGKRLVNIHYKASEPISSQQPPLIDHTSMVSIQIYMIQDALYKRLDNTVLDINLFWEEIKEFSNMLDEIQVRALETRIESLESHINDILNNPSAQIKDRILVSRPCFKYPKLNEEDEGNKQFNTVLQIYQHLSSIPLNNFEVTNNHKSFDLLIEDTLTLLKKIAEQLKSNSDFFTEAEIDYSLFLHELVNFENIIIVEIHPSFPKKDEEGLYAIGKELSKDIDMSIEEYDSQISKIINDKPENFALDTELYNKLSVFCEPLEDNSETLEEAATTHQDIGLILSNALDRIKALKIGDSCSCPPDQLERAALQFSDILRDIKQQISSFEGRNPQDQGTQETGSKSGNQSKKEISQETQEKNLSEVSEQSNLLSVQPDSSQNFVDNTPKEKLDTKNTPIASKKLEIASDAEGTEADQEIDAKTESISNEVPTELSLTTAQTVSGTPAFQPAPAWRCIIL